MYLLVTFWLSYQQHNYKARDMTKAGKMTEFSIQKQEKLSQWVIYVKFTGYVDNPFVFNQWHSIIPSVLFVKCNQQRTANHKRWKTCIYFFFITREINPISY